MAAELIDVRIHGRRARVLRGGAGEPVLYLHGEPGETLLRPPHLLALAEGHELHAPIHPGFHTSEGLEHVDCVEDLAYHYRAYLDQAELGSAHVVGFGLGGWIAAELAVRFPERVATLALVNSFGIWVEEAPIADIFVVDLRFPERFVELVFHDPRCPAARVALAGMRVDAPEDVLLESLRATAAAAKLGWNPLLHDPRLEKRLDLIRAPTLCLWAEKNRVVPPVYGEKLARLIPGARLETVPDCGHWLPLEKPDAFVEAVSRFVGASGAGRRPG